MLCRMCVIESNDFVNIFGTEVPEYELCFLIERYLQIQVKDEDAHSTSICRLCLETLTAFHTFCQRIKSAQKKWEIVPSVHLIKMEIVAMEDGCKDSLSGNNWESLENESGTNSDLDFDLKNGAANSNKATTTSVKLERQKSRKPLWTQINKLIESHTKLFCTECNAVATSFKELRKHFKEEHSKAGYMVCCKRKFFCASDLADHINVHLNPEYFKCKPCDKSFSSRYTLNVHTKTLHESESTYVACPKCPKKFLRKCILEKHILIHNTRVLDSGEHLCAECGRSYPTESKLKAHHFNVHTSIYSRICHVCGKIVRGDKALKTHQLEHAGMKQKVKCEVCGVELSTKGILKAHMIALHPTDTSETHVCDVCGKVAPSKRALKFHIDYVHKSERSYTCSLCEKSFKKFQALKEHITSHTGDRLYECPHCTQTFKILSNMHQHRKAKHPKEFEEGRKNRTRRK